MARVLITRQQYKCTKGVAHHFPEGQELVRPRYTGDRHWTGALTDTAGKLIDGVRVKDTDIKYAK